jgi:RNA polymerase sigma-70 factor (ECF subfamily)
MDHAEEKQLVHKLTRMDERAWETFCAAYAAPLRAFARVQLGCDANMAEELVQTAFLRCVRSIRTFDPARGRLFPWLKAILRNARNDALSAGRNIGNYVPASGAADIACPVLEAIDTAPLPDAVLEREDVKLLVHETLVELPARFHDALHMKYLERLSMADMARRGAGSEKAVESLLTRSREAFRKLFLEKLRASGLERNEVYP